MSQTSKRSSGSGQYAAMRETIKKAAASAVRIAVKSAKTAKSKPSSSSKSKK